MAFGGLHDKARELRVNEWIDADGMSMDKPVRLADLGQGYKVIFCFQDWCPGCHSRGFPTLKFLHDGLKDKGFGFAVIQTVFEGAEENTFDKLRLNQERYGLAIPFGQDLPPEGERYPTFMEDTVPAVRPGSPSSIRQGTLSMLISVWTRAASLPRSGRMTPT